MMNGLHIYRCENPVRTRAMCLHHRRLCYGEKQEFYDTMRIFFDCGTRNEGLRNYDTYASVPLFRYRWY